jgi:hypothetical protein
LKRHVFWILRASDLVKVRVSDISQGNRAPNGDRYDDALEIAEQT